MRLRSILLLPFMQIGTSMDLELSEDEWSSIRLVASWLEKFRDATTQVSATHQPMLSYTHAIFRGLQEHLRKSLHDLPAGVNPCIRDGLVVAHLKLSKYYYRFDQSPFYIWAARMFISFSIVPQLTFQQFLTQGSLMRA
jgi:hypothetical protein